VLNHAVERGDQLLQQQEPPGPWQFYPEALSEFAGQHVALKHVFRKEKPYIFEKLSKKWKNGLIIVSDPLHFGVDPDPDPRIHASD
jgi:hypothetical protein